MPVIKQSKIVPFSAEQMYLLVNDVRAYPEFLPWCRATKIENETSTTMIASILVSKGPLQKWFSTKNTLTYGQTIKLELFSGPFEYLNGLWEFRDLENQCQVNFELDFKLKLNMTSFLLEPLFGMISQTMVQSFCQRASVIYGNNSKINS